MSGDTPERRRAADKVAEVADLILDGLTKTDAIAQVFGDNRTYRRAVKGRPDLEYLVFQAMSEQTDMLADQALAIADDSSLDPNTARNRIQVRQWFASKRAPQKYGDRLEVVGIQTISVTSALEAALVASRARVQTLVPPVIDAEVIPEVPELNHAPAEWPDIFS